MALNIENNNGDNNNTQTVVHLPLMANDKSNETDTDMVAPIFEPLSQTQINQLVKQAKESFKTGRTKSTKFRKEQLKQILKLLDENKQDICDALKKDLNKPMFETIVCELNLLVNEVLEFLHLIDSFSAPESKEKTFMTMFDKVFVQNEPLGTVLIMGAWNYPLLLSLQPMVGAIAAGNCVIMKMSEHAPHTGKLLADLVSKYLDRDCYKMINCDLPTTQYLLNEHKFDHIFYTGGENGGKAVYTAASKTLTPVVLELGGKSPVYIDDDVCDREAVWSRLFWGKFINAGQTCIAPDYVLCSEKAQQMARKYFHKALNQFYNNDPSNNENYARIVNYQHFDRLKKLIKESRMVIGGKLYKEKLSIEPAIVLDCTLDDAVMQEEIFGPILPFVTCSSAQKAIEIISSRPKPLALYVFSDSKKLQDKFLKETSSGGVCINDTIIHISAVSLPFGGVGGSGIGKYHGRYSLDLFSNSRSVLSRGFNPLLEWIGSNRYPPYNNTKLTILTQLGLNRKIWLPGPKLTNCLAFATGAASIIAYQTFATMF